MSNSRSFGSNCNRWSQSRKISIGVMVDYSANTRPKTRKEDEVVLPNVEKVPAKVNYTGDGKCGEGAKDAIQGKQTSGPEYESSPWVSTRSFHLKQQSPEVIHNAELTTDLPGGYGMPNSLSGVTKAPITCPVQCLGNQISGLQSGDAKQKNCDGFSYENGGKNGPNKRVEEFLFAAAWRKVCTE